MRILVCGSRRWPRSEEAPIRHQIVGCLYESRLNARRSTLVVGDAPGVDAIAHLVGVYWGMQIDRHIAERETHGRKAGPLRNRAMLDTKPDIVLAFPAATSVGTWDTIREARRRGIPVRIFPRVPLADHVPEGGRDTHQEAHQKPQEPRAAQEGIY